MAKRGKRTLSGRFLSPHVGSTLHLRGRWTEDPERVIQLTVFAADIPKLKAAIETFERSPLHEEAPVDPQPTNADGRKTFKKIGDRHDND